MIRKYRKSHRGDTLSTVYFNFQKHFNGSFVLLEAINNKAPENKK
jgi:hypothetical protein